MTESGGRGGTPEGDSAGGNSVSLFCVSHERGKDTQSTKNFIPSLAGAGMQFWGKCEPSQHIHMAVDV